MLAARQGASRAKRYATPPAESQAPTSPCAPIGSPLPLTYLSMAAGTLFLGGPQIGYIAGNEVICLGLGLVAFCFPLHLLAATLAFLGRDAVAGLASGVLAGVWLVGGIEMLMGGTGDEGSGLGRST